LSKLDFLLRGPCDISVRRAAEILLEMLHCSMYTFFIRKRVEPEKPRRDKMANTTDYTKVMQDMMAKFPVDASAFQNAFKTQAAFSEKLSKVALEAAEKSTEISSKWAKETIAKLSGAAKAKVEPADYTKAATDFASAAAELAAENMAAFAEVAKKVQMETVELMLAAGKDASAEASAVVKKATEEVQNVAKKATAAAAK
jgi:hypothetical protein